MVRMLCIRGLGNVASLPEEQLRKHSTTVLSAMMTGMDDRNDPGDDITLEAMRGLNKIFAKVRRGWDIVGYVVTSSNFIFPFQNRWRKIIFEIF